MTVNRYEFEDYGALEESGRYVTYEDYEELESAYKAAMLTISQITDVVGTSDTLSISQQVAELAAGKDTFLQIALSEVAEHFDMLPNAGTREWDAVKLSCMNKLREIFG
ncbi:hypothetical protein MUA04_08920 [Enterobacteriaceae bacterium H11S18]|uniref:hypothetical protein n=1 Tax=Dryocola clanedunensis TaxID=2925396 RepID=UPI0022F10A3A|nr:hypothetical protein [Dryocola clanedunensis]MCT4710309.1 hypothetical protein [Dryocola clanedunensis]